MAHRGEVKQSETFEKVFFPETSKMRNYELVYDDEVKQMRCGFYKNKTKDQNFDKDYIWVIEPGYEHRLDLISLKFYETCKLDWFIADANNIKDPIRDIVAGRKIIIPDRSKLK